MNTGENPVHDFMDSLFEVIAGKRISYPDSIRHFIALRFR